jgi:signal transduction histidine kinase/ligand-binding sensor domain-containing protein/DNA-binding response OmpR family regulator
MAKATINPIRISLYIINKLLFCFLFLFHSFSVGSQPNHLKFDNYRIENGLSNNMVHCAFQDSKGWMWFGTAEGLNRFDGYNFVWYMSDAKDSTKLKGNSVRCIYEDNKGFLWFGSGVGGVSRFDRKTGVFKNYLDDKSVTAIKALDDNNLWLSTTSGLYLLNTSTGKSKVFQKSNKEGWIHNDSINDIEYGPDKKLWIATYKGLYVYDKTTNKFNSIIYQDGNVEDEAISIFFDNENAWIGTYYSGFYIYNLKTKSVEHLIPDSRSERSKTVRKIMKDQKGIYWIGTRGGLYLYDKETRKFSFYSYSDREQSSLGNNSIADIIRDSHNNMWLATRGGISLMASDKQAFKHYKSIEGDNSYLNNKEIYAFWLENNQNLWIGTESGGINILNFQTGKYQYITRGANPKLESNTIKCFEPDNQGNLWVGSFLGGISVIDIKSRTIKRSFLKNVFDNNSISDNRVWTIHRDINGNMWIGSDGGLDMCNIKTGKIEHYSQLIKGKPALWISEDKEHDLWISTSKFIYVYNVSTHKVKEINAPGRELFIDSKNRYWLTTNYKGLILVDKNKGPLKFYDTSNGIIGKRTYCIFEDKQGFLWISTSAGLSKFDPEKEKAVSYDVFDGLQNDQFNYGAGLKLPSGELIFGGVNGFNIFNPEDIKPQKESYPLVFTDFRIFYKPVPISDNRDAILHKDISLTQSITIPYDQNVFQIDFALLNYSKSLQNKYSYMLEGFDKTWNNAGNQHSVVYTNLNPGKYILKVKAHNSGIEGADPEISLNIRVTPPFYGTVFFKILMVIIVFAIVYFLLQILMYRNKIKQEVVLERIKARQIHELDLIKMKFFTNISHEIRTPLTLILGPTDRLLNETLSENETKSLLSLIHRNAGQLLKLVNQLLDFRKVESGNLKLDLKKGDIVSFVKSIISSFDQMAVNKGVSLKINTVQNEIFSFFDSDKLEKIVNNLLSNAIKYTNRGGTVAVSISLILDSIDDSRDSADTRFIEIVVKDTGIGINENNLRKIFNRFFQVNEMPDQTGSGLGLTFTRELVKLHKGKINVESVPQKGSRFVVLLPLLLDDSNEIIGSISNSENKPCESFDKDEIDDSASEKLLLVIDDNQDVRYYIRSHFEPEFKVIEAADGKEGLNTSFKFIPDIIIADIMMPGIDGIDLCRKIKKDERTSHIPVILLTALTDRESVQQGLGAGADDYITKPFDMSLLHIKVDNLLMLRRSLQMKYSGEVILQPKNVSIVSPDEKFLRKAVETVEKFMDDADLDTDKFAQILGVSRMQLYRKIGALTDMTVKDFIREIRLKRAAQLLVQNKINVSEVAYAVGFKDLSHFRRCFRQQYGMTATEYIKKFAE